MPTSTTKTTEQTNLPQERERFGVEEERITDPLANSDAFGLDLSGSESLMAAPAADFSMAGNASAEMSAVVAPVPEATQPIMPLAGEDFSMEEEPMAGMEEILELSPVAAPADENNGMNGNSVEALEAIPAETLKEESDKAVTEEAEEVSEEKQEQPEETEEQELVLQPPRRRTITEPFPSTPDEDAAFDGTAMQVVAVAETEATTNPAAQDAASAQLAAPMASNEEMGNAQRQQVTDMQQQETGTFDAEAFKEKLLKRIKDMSLPSNLEQADNFDDNNNIDSVRRSAMSDVAAQEETAAGPLRETTAERPDPESVPQREVAEVPDQPVGEQPEPVPASEGMPAPRPDSHILFPLEDDMTEVRYEFDSNEITDEQLRIANEPTFTHALDSKEEVQANVNTAPEQFRAEEQQQLEITQANADVEAQQQTEAMHTARTEDLASVAEEQETTGQNDSEERRKIAADIKTIYDQTKTNVEKILNDLKEDVKTKFDNAAASAKSKFENHVARRFRIYKNNRYSGPTGALKWGKDKLFDMPSEVNVFFVEGRNKYISSMDTSLTNIATYVAGQLTAAKKEITNGQTKVQNYVAKLPTNLKNVGEQAARNIQNEFDKLTSSVEDAQDGLIDSLAQQYVDNLAQVDQRIEEMKEENKGLVTKAKEAVEEVIDTVGQIKDTLAALLSSALSVIGSIVADPIGFLSNLISGIAQGFTNFGKNIVGNITTGLITWLTGSLGGLGIQVPENVLSLSGMFDLATQVLGLTWDYFRQKAVKLLGERVVSAMETGVEIFQIVKKDGMQGLWEHIKAEFADLKSMVMDAIRDMIITKVIEAGIKWILGLMSPAGAFIKAAMMIIDIVKFFIERGSQILELVNAFIEGIKAIASGNVSAVAKAIENALIKAIPVLIGFLAALAGVTGLTRKVQDLIERLRNRIDRAIDKIILKAKQVFGNLVRSGRVAADNQIKDELDPNSNEGQKLLKNVDEMKEPFTNRSGKKHHLDFIREGKDIVLVRRSIPVALKEHVMKLNNAIRETEGLSDADRRTFGLIISNVEEEQSSIEKIINEIESLFIRRKKTESGYIDVKKNNFSIETGAKIKVKLDAIADELSKLPEIGGDGKFIIDTNQERPVSADVIFETEKLTMSNGQKSTDAKKMTAPVLSRRGPGNTTGSQPNSAGYSELYSRLKSFGRNVVAAHLLNHQIFGKGNNFENLTPVPGPKNTEMEGNLEATAKNAILKENKVIKYEVEAHYNTTKVAKTSIDEGSFPAKGDLPDDALIPNKITGSIKEMKPKEGVSGSDLQKASQWEESGRSLTPAVTTSNIQSALIVKRDSTSKIDYMSLILKKLDNKLAAKPDITWNKVTNDNSFKALIQKYIGSEIYEGTEEFDAIKGEFYRKQNQLSDMKSSPTPVRSIDEMLVLVKKHSYIALSEKVKSDSNLDPEKFYSILKKKKDYFTVKFQGYEFENELSTDNIRQYLSNNLHLKPRLSKSKEMGELSDYESAQVRKELIKWLTLVFQLAWQKIKDSPSSEESTLLYNQIIETINDWNLKFKDGSIEDLESELLTISTQRDRFLAREDISEDQKIDVQRKFQQIEVRLKTKKGNSYTFFSSVVNLLQSEQDNLPQDHAEYEALSPVDKRELIALSTLSNFHEYMKLRQGYSDAEIDELGFSSQKINSLNSMVDALKSKIRSITSSS